MMKTTYNGVTRRLGKPIEANGKSFPFAFDSDMPGDLHTAYRVITTTDPDALTNESIGEMIDASQRKKLLADLEKNEGHPISWLSVYADAEEGTRSSGGDKGSTSGGRRAQFEKGPDLEPTKDKTKEPEKTQERAPSPEKVMRPLPPEPVPPQRGPEPGMF
jgi:hypothetical protein